MKKKKIAKGKRVSKTPPKKPTGPEKGSISKYPYDLWLDGKSKWLLRRGKEFHCLVSSFRFQIRAEATRRGLSIRIYSGKSPNELVIENAGPLNLNSVLKRKPTSFGKKLR